MTYVIEDSRLCSFQVLEILITLPIWYLLRTWHPAYSLAACQSVIVLPIVAICVPNS